MQTWTKRGIQTALVTGGLLLLGTGIASADENVNPDTPAGPIDLTVSVPYQVKDNAIGAPGGQVDLPEGEGEISTKAVTDAANQAAAPVTEAAGEAAPKETPLSGTEQGPLKANKVVGNVAVPVQATGNAVGALGDAEVDSSNTQSYEHTTDVSTDGSDSGAAGNAVVADWALPVQVAGNAGGVAGSGKTTGDATQSGTTTGEITTGGDNSALGGNVVSPQFATPVQASGNAIGWIAGNANSDFDSTSEATSGGPIETSGAQSAGSGNVAGAPVGLPVRVAGNAVSWGGNAHSTSNTEANATAGGKKTGLNDIDSFIQTTGDESFLSGNIAQPQAAGIASVTGDAVAWVGNSTTGNALGGADRDASATGSSTSNTEAGGFSSTSGKDSAVSGNLADVPVALPAEVFGVGAAWIGNAHAAHDSATDAVAGDGTFTNGQGSFAGGNSAHVPAAGTAEVFGVAGSLVGNVSGTASEDKNVESGGYNGTIGDESTVGGNVVQVPAAVPAEVFGAGAGAAGQAVGEAHETKVVSAGGDGNTDDDFGFGSSNAVATPLSVPAQVFGIGGTAVGQGHGIASTDTTSTAGGDYTATGVLGTAAGNIVQVPGSLPAQVHGLGAGAVGNATGTSDNLTDSTAGGTSTADGTSGSIAGNIVQAPVGGAGSVFGLGAAGAGVTGGNGINDVVSTAGGDAQTAGDAGAAAGNVVSAHALPVAQAFGDAASLVGVTHGVGSNTTDATSGGDVETSGVEGAISGNILDVPAGAVPQVFGDAASVGGVATAIGDNVTTGSAGGATETAGAPGSLTGIDGQLPVGAVVPVHGIPIEVLANAIAASSDNSDVTVGEQAPQIDRDLGGALGATELPELGNAFDLPKPAMPMERSAELPGSEIADVELLDEAQLPTAPGNTAVVPNTALPQQRSADLPTDQVSSTFESATGELPVGELAQQRSADLPTGSFTGLLPKVDGLSAPVQADLPAVEDTQEHLALSDWFFGSINK
ncbi:hypothetical protein EV191_1011352 [Tamaricihabitans halophyticus]|uniref:Small secreted domain DUF320 n=1 Tax=Tamaricihabitans halophyticus TaxID=1262583 RepID=A0A4R2R5U3_9PSEU|nr:hypothetical protein [Tamaricihabitans halophyticus]TCP57397.1 hypothetical protein EV191_1011352 [Tamaricihabitans halophyticus]